MEVEFRLTRHDANAFFWHLYAMRWLISGTVILMGCVILAGTIGFSIDSSPEMVWYWFGFPFLVVASAGFYLYRTWLEFAKAALELERRFESGTGRMHVAPDGLSYSTPATQTFVKWPGIRRIAETSTHAFFFIAESQAFILPARAFASPVEFRTFVGLARSYMEKRVPELPQQPTGPSDRITRRDDITT